MRVHPIIATILFFLCCLTATKSAACRCATHSFQDDSDKSDLIFSGVAIDRRDSISIGKVFYTFKVTKVWKGHQYETLTIKTNYGGQACGATFNLNREYVVFAMNMETNRCRRNSETSICSDIARLNYKYITSYNQSIAVDTSPILSKAEGDYFNILFKDRSDTMYRIDFSNKKVAFYVYGQGLIKKRQFFEQYGAIAAPIGFEKFSESEVHQSNGYVGIIHLYRKLKFAKREKKKLIKQLI